jgi:hypothetical protein
MGALSWRLMAGGTALAGSGNSGKGVAGVGWESIDIGFGSAIALPLIL